MESDNQEILYCEDDCEYRIYCDTCDKLCIERYYKNHLKSGTHTINFYKSQRLNNTNKFIYSNTSTLMELNNFIYE